MLNSVNPSSNDDKSPSNLFKSRQNMYGLAVINHQGQHDLADDVSVEKLKERSHHHIIRIRNLQTDNVFPFDAESFLQWFEMNHEKPSHPHTREDLSYLKKRVAFKRRVLQLRDVSVDNADDINNSDAKQTDVMIAYLKDHMDHRACALDPDTWIKCCDMVQLDTLEKAGWIWKDLNFPQTVNLLKAIDVPVGSWLLRKSSKHGSIMPNADVFVLAFKKAESVVHISHEENKDPEESVRFTVSQIRYIYVHGVGIYDAGDDHTLKTFKLLHAENPDGPAFVTIAELLSAYASTQAIHPLRLLQSSSNDH